MVRAHTGPGDELVMVLLVSLLLDTARAGCDNVAILEDARAVEAAFGDNLPERTLRQGALLDEDLRCLTEALTRESARAIWRARALIAVSRPLAQQDPAEATGALRAALAIDADPALALTWLGPGLPLTVALADARAQGAGDHELLAALPGTVWIVDGDRTTQRPIERPFVAQCLWLTDNSVHATAVVLPGGALPVCPAPPVPDPAACEDRLGKGLTWGLAGGAAGLLGTSAASLAIHRSAYAEFASSTPLTATSAEVEALAHRANRSLGVAIGTSAIGLGVAAPLAWKGCWR